MNPRCLTKILWFGQECIRYACEDLQRDIKEACGSQAEIIAQGAFSAGCILTGTLENPSFRAAAMPYLKELPTGWEAYRLLILPDRIIIAGSDKRGTMWGIYALSRMLGIPPCVRFVPVEIKPCSFLQEGHFAGASQTYRFRGWFLNDEDLLSDWHLSGRHREMDYPFYRNITAVESLAPVVETALRMNINLMIPASFLDIDDPAQEALVAYCTGRGLYVSQHHIEPLGVSHFTYQSFYQKEEEKPVFSFVTQREKAEKIWRYYAAKWAKYEDVVWQLGLRGKADRPVWHDDDAFPGAAEWGKIISDAVQTQYKIIEEICGKEFYSTSTLWMEGSRLYADGYLSFPENTMLIFADVGPTQMLTTDFYQVPREKGRQYGIYYHAAYWGDGPHLAQGTDIRKMVYNYTQALKKGDTAYSILNVANLRETVLPAAANAQIVWDFKNFETERFYRAWCREVFDQETVWPLWEQYFNAFIDAGWRELEKRYGKYFEFCHGEYAFTYYAGNDGFVRATGLIALQATQQGKNIQDSWIPALSGSIQAFEAVLKKAMEYEQTPALYEQLIFPIKYMIAMETWALACEEYARKSDLNCLRQATEALQALLQEREKMEQGIWENWYRGDAKVNVSGLLQRTLEIKAAAEKAEDSC